MSERSPGIRRAVAGDADLVWSLARDFATTFTPEREAFDRTFAGLLAADDALLLVAECGYEVVGYLLGHRHATFLANGPVAWVEELMIDEGSRRTGIGGRLMAHAEDWARSCGCAYLALASRRAAAFYSALGYEDSAVYFRKLLA